MKLVYSHNYDQSYNPSAPVVEIKVGKPFAIPALKLIALVDSGSDSLIIPLPYLKGVGALKEKRVWMRNVGGSRFAVDLYSISLSFGPYEYDDIRVVGGIQNDEVILGRDLLNQFIVTLNGLATVVDFER